MHNNDVSQFYINLLDELADTLVDSISDITRQIEEIKARTTVLDGIEPGKQYVAGQLASHKSGLWRFDGRDWKCLVNTIDSVTVEEVRGGANLVLEQSNGTKVSQHLKFPTPKRRPVKIAA